MLRLLSCLCLLSSAQANAGSIEVGVQIYKIFKPTSVRLAAGGGRPLALSIVAEDGRRHTLSTRAVEIRCGGRTPLAVHLGAKVLPAANLEVRPAGPDASIRVGVPGSAQARPYPGWFHVSEGSGRCRIVNRVDLEDYVAATTCRELGAAPAEAMRAQAILVRTWALARRGRHAAAGADFCDLTHCQVYEGLTACDAAARRSLDSVEGKVLLFDDRLADVAYASTCGGHTARAADIWGPGSARAYLEGRADGEPALCSASPHFRWRFEVDRAAVCAAIRKAEPALGSGSCRLKVEERGAGGWIRRIRITATNEIDLSGERFHLLMGRAFGWGRFKSANFTIQARSKRIAFLGRGLGHGVGLCQYGAMAMATKGADHRAILEHYFPGTRIGTAP